MGTENDARTTVDSDVRSAFDGVPSAVVSDVVDRGVAMDSGIEPIDPGTELVGRARTVNAAPGDNLAIHRAITLAEPGDVLVVDGEGYTETASVGELMCASCRAHDLAGLVIDGAIRDRAEVARMGFPVFARGTHPAGPGKEFEGSVDEPVTCGGIRVEPGDLVVGDGDGVCVVPASEAASVLERAREKLDAEAELLDRVEGGEYLYEIGGYGDVEG
ncbi:RraA family protein [Natronorarus salvus]|uniref:RraA family protein n=1 Tax=Natronorarus salvus TaxID=3117733 RepID=UPI002F265A68